MKLDRIGGLIAGFIFGLISPFLASFGLISLAAGYIGLIFWFPGPLLIRLVIHNFGSGMFGSAMVIAMILNAVFYAFIGQFLQKRLKNTRYVVLIFVGIIVLIIVAIVVESFVRSYLGLHVGA